MHLRINVIILTMLVTNACQTKYEDDIQTVNSTTSTSTTSGSEELVQKINDFSHRLLLKCAELNKGGNVVLGPSTIAGVMSLVLLGTIGDSYSELADALGFSQDIFTNRKNHEEFGAILKQLNNNDNSSSTITLMSNTMFLDINSHLRPVFEQYAKRVYDIQIQKNNFHDVDLTRTSINSWVKEHTNGKITNLLGDNLPEYTKVVLISAHYFSGTWAYPFQPIHTKKMTFHKPSGEIMADLMLTHGNFKYVISNEYEYHLLGLPYIDNSTYLYAVIPFNHKKLTLQELLSQLNWNNLNALIEKATIQPVLVRFPKMKLSSKINLKMALARLGIRTIFDPLKANFALMLDDGPKINSTEEELLTRVIERHDTNRDRVQSLLDGLTNPNVYLSEVIHKVLMNIDEYGTEAVSATAGILVRSLPMFRADSPFIMFIRDEKTRLVTFSGIVNDPTE